MNSWGRSYTISNIYRIIAARTAGTAGTAATRTAAGTARGFPPRSCRLAATWAGTHGRSLIVGRSVGILTAEIVFGAETENG